MKKFAELFSLIDQTQSTNEKVNFIRDYFKVVPSADGAWALFFLCGHRLKRLISSKNLMEWCMEETSLPLWLVEECSHSVGDTAETIALLLSHKQAQKTSSQEMTLAEWMEKKILPLRGLSLDEQKASICQSWKDLNDQERFIFNKILTGGFRVGVSHLLTLKGLSEAFDISRESLSQRLMGNWEPSAAFFDSLTINGDVSPGAHLNPYPFYLASPLENSLSDLGVPEGWLAEWKWDGIRVQCISRKGKYAIWSRGNELISHQFPEIIEALQSLPDNLVLDGEILAFKDDSPLPFGELQKRLGRKKPSKSVLEEVPISLMMYDLLEYEGEDIRQFSLFDRRQKLELLINVHSRILLSPSVDFQNWETLHEKRLLAREGLTEGIMLKKWNSTYGVGRQRGNWWKYKIDPLTIDAVLLYAQAGRGRRANLYTDYTFGVWKEKELVPIAKAYSGLSQKEIDELDRWIRKNTLEKFGPVRKVKAEQVFEIAFEGIQKSNRHKSGLAMRFPRILRWRKDKPPEECDTIESIYRDFLS